MCWSILILKVYCIKLLVADFFIETVINDSSGVTLFNILCKHDDPDDRRNNINNIINNPNNNAII